VAAIGQPVRVGTWNVHEGFTDNDHSDLARDRAAAATAQMIRSYGLDLVAFQEVDFDQDGYSRVLAAVQAGTELQHIQTWMLSPSSFVPDGRSGLAIASRYPIASSSTYKIPNPELEVDYRGTQIRTFDKGILACLIDAPVARLCLGSIHSYPFHRFQRQAQESEFAMIWQELADFVTTICAGRLLVAGDFNTARRDLLTEKTDLALRRAVGEVPTHRGLPMDDILYSDGLAMLGQPKVVPNFSDHHLCIADFDPV
jgi:endonuclease/exonuclease/phosphatase family metal-dependent hydrolase